MSLIKKINDPNGKKYDDFSIGSLVLDTEPIPGSFNTITSDAVVKAIDKAKDDMQEKIDEVTLDPSAVALGNVHLLDEVTEFPADGCILVDSETNGPGKMPKDTLLTLTSQNALAGNVAPAFDPTKPNDEGGYAYYSGENVTYNGKNYVFVVNHSSGAWNASEVEHKPLSESINLEGVGQAVREWLDEHPEATTTVQDDSITDDKLSPTIKHNRLSASSRYGYKLLNADISFESQVVEPSVIYEVRWGYDLGGETIDVDGICLFFNGGSITNGILRGTPKIIAKNPGCLKDIEFEDCNTMLEMNWLCPVTSYERDDNVDNSDDLEAALNCGAKNLKFTNEVYRITRTITIDKDVNIFGPSQRNAKPNDNAGFITLCGVYSSYDGTLLRFTFPATAGNRVRKNIGGFSVHQFSNTNNRTDAISLVEITTSGTIWGLNVDIDVVNHCSDVLTLPDGTATTELVPKASYTGITIYPGQTNESVMTFVRVYGYIHKCFTGVKFGKLSSDTSNSWITSLKLYADTWCGKGAIVNASETIVYGTHQPIRVFKASEANDGYFDCGRNAFIYGFVWDLGSSDGVAYNTKFAMKHRGIESQTERAAGVSNQPVLENSFFPKNNSLTPYENFGRLGNIVGFNVYADDNAYSSGDNKICTINEIKFIKKSDPSVEFNVEDVIDNVGDVFNVNNLLSNPNNQTDTPISSCRAGINTRLFYALDGELWTNLVLKIDFTLDISKFYSILAIQNLVCQHQMWDASCVIKMLDGSDNEIYSGSDFFTSSKYNGIFTTDGVVTKDVYSYIMQHGYTSSVKKLRFIFSFETALGGNVFYRNLPCLGIIANLSSVIDRNGGHIAGQLLCNNLNSSDKKSSLILSSDNYNIYTDIPNTDTFVKIVNVRYRANESNAVAISGKIDENLFTIVAKLNLNNYQISSLKCVLPVYVSARATTYSSTHKDYSSNTYYNLVVEVKASQSAQLEITNVTLLSANSRITSGADAGSTMLDLKQSSGLRGGATRYNSTNKRMELYNGTSWVNMDGTPLAP